MEQFKAFFTPEVRNRLYLSLVIIFGIAVAHGFVTHDDSQALLSLLSTVFFGVASRNTPVASRA